MTVSYLGLAVAMSAGQKQLPFLPLALHTPLCLSVALAILIKAHANNISVHDPSTFPVRRDVIQVKGHGKPRSAATVTVSRSPQVRRFVGALVSLAVRTFVRDQGKGEVRVALGCQVPEKFRPGNFVLAIAVR